jgi:hypothetical protein
MKPYSTMKPAERETEYLSLKEQYRKFTDKGLKLDMTRGKPGEDQLELAMPMLDVLTSDSDCRDSTGMDCRNYGGLLALRMRESCLETTSVFLLKKRS